MTHEIRHYPALVALATDEGIETSLGTFTTLLARTVQLEFGDAVIALRLRPRGGLTSGPMSGQQGVTEAHLSISADPVRASVEIAQTVERLRNMYAYLFLDPSAIEPALAKVILRRLGDAELLDITKKLVFLTRERVSPPGEGWHVLRTDLLAPGPVNKPDVMRERAEVGMKVARAEVKRIRRGPDSRGEPAPSEMMMPEWCRARLDLEKPERTSRETLARWARTLTDRRVGLALGGSGAWGYAHVAMMQALSELTPSVPIDLIAGSSSGSLMGAYYSVRGEEGLRLVVKRGPRIATAALLSTISSAFLEAMVSMDLGLIRLDETEIVFIPMATNLANGKSEILLHATVGFGVRASGSAPGIFAATIAERAVYVDGAVMNNVPAGVVERMGADLVIAVNPLPPPAKQHVPVPSNPVQRFLEEFSPVHRVKSLAASFSLMFHNVGDRESEHHARIVYDPPPEPFPLLGTLDFAKAEEIVDQVRGEPQFQDCVARAGRAWVELSRPRGGP